VRAVIVEHLGGSDALTVADIDPPRPAPGQVVVEVAAAGVNFMDVYQREGRGYAVPPPFPLGQEGAGTVAAVGDGVSGVRVGDRVAWTAGQGSYAERVAVAAASVVPVPDGVDLDVAAAVMLQGMTAHYLTHSTYAVQAGDLAVVHAAAGGVGLLLTQLVKKRGGTVVATTSTEEKAALARQAGADRVVGYDRFVDTVREVSGGAGAAVVYDGVGQATFEDGLVALRRRGILVLYGASSGPVPPFDLQRLNAAGSLYVTRPTLGHYIADRDELTWRTSDLFGWITDGSLHVRVGATYALEDVRRAHDDLEGRRTTGKLLLRP
jgi:NADPH2:quinone reductase